MDFSLIVENYRNMKRLKEGKITSSFVNWGKTAQQTKALAAEPKDLISIPRTHRVARTDSHRLSLHYTRSHIHIHYWLTAEGDQDWQYIGLNKTFALKQQSLPNPL